MPPSGDPAPTTTAKTKLTLLSAVRHAMSILASICLLAGMIIAILALLPAFDGQELPRMGLEVTDWTA